MPAVIIKHKVADFAVWLAAFEAHAPAREAMGATKSIVWQEADDPNSVVVLIKVSDLDKAREFTANPQLKEVMDSAGVLGPPTIMFLDNGQKYDSQPQSAGSSG